MVVTLFGSTGHMGIQTLKEFLKVPEITQIRLLLRPDSPRKKPILRLKKKYKDRIRVFYGNIASKDNIEEIVDGSNYLFNLAAVIPPLSDKNPSLSFRVNELGAYNIVEVLEHHPEVKFIHITSVALYGHRNYKHPFCRIGDPLMPSVFDVYSVNKMRGELKVLESSIPHFAIIRQTAMIYPSIIMSNMDDGLMFHTCFNDPLEWSTAEDSAVLMANIVKEDILGNLNHDNFWNKIFNLGEKEDNRISGYKVLDNGLRIIGKKVENIYKPNDNVTRNFHGGFYLDSDKLDNLFHYQHDSLTEYWKKIKRKYPYLAFARIVPSKLIRKFAIEKLYKDPNSPKYWYEHNDEARLIAFYGSKEAYESISSDWKDFKLWDYTKNRSVSTYKPIDYGFDINKDDKDITLEDLISVASKHGGKLLTKSYKTGDVYTPLEWENSDGERFYMKPYSVIRGGHWMNPLYKSYTWDFDRLAKKDALYASYWYDSHEKNEDHTYYFSDTFEAKIR